MIEKSLNEIVQIELNEALNAKNKNELAIVESKAKLEEISERICGLKWIRDKIKEEEAQDDTRTS